jgi:hypothetical protein
MLGFSDPHKGITVLVVMRVSRVGEENIVGEKYEWV